MPFVVLIGAGFPTLVLLPAHCNADGVASLRKHAAADAICTCANLARPQGAAGCALAGIEM